MQTMQGIWVKNHYGKKIRKASTNINSVFVNREKTSIAAEEEKCKRSILQNASNVRSAGLISGPPAHAHNCLESAPQDCSIEIISSKYKNLTRWALDNAATILQTREELWKQEKWGHWHSWCTCLSKYTRNIKVFTYTLYNNEDKLCEKVSSISSNVLHLISHHLNCMRNVPDQARTYPGSVSNHQCDIILQ